MCAKDDFKLALEKNTDELIHQQIKKQIKKNEIEKLLQGVKKIQHKIIKKEKYQGQVKAAIQGCEERHESLEIMKNKLKSVTGSQKLEAQSNDATIAIVQNQIWEETQRKVYKS